MRGLRGTGPRATDSKCPCATSTSVLACEGQALALRAVVGALCKRAPSPGAQEAAEDMEGCEGQALALRTADALRHVNSVLACEGQALALRAVVGALCKRATSPGAQEAAEDMRGLRGTDPRATDSKCP